MHDGDITYMTKSVYSYYSYAYSMLAETYYATSIPSRVQTKLQKSTAV